MCTPLYEEGRSTEPWEVLTLLLLKRRAWDLCRGLEPNLSRKLGIQWAWFLFQWMLWLAICQEYLFVWKDCDSRGLQPKAVCALLRPRNKKRKLSHINLYRLAEKMSSAKVGSLCHIVNVSMCTICAFSLKVDFGFFTQWAGCATQNMLH